MTDETNGAAAEAPTEADMLATIENFGKEAPAPEPVVEAPKPEGDDPPADEATPAAPEGESTPAKPRQTAAERIAEITAARREAERQADYWKGVAEGRAQPAPAATAAQTDQPASDGAPNPDEYVFGVEDQEYQDDRTRYVARLEFNRLEAEKAQRTAADQAVTTYAEREQAFAAKNADFNEVVIEGGKAKAWLCSDDMAEAIRDSEDGPAIAYHLAKNPDEAARIAALTPVAQIREIGKLEAKLATPAANPAPAAKLITSAPEPAPTLRGEGGKFKVAADTDNFADFDKQYG